MASIYFVGTYKPIVCGIADYIDFLSRACPAGKWGVLSFDPDTYGGPLARDCRTDTTCAWYGIPGRNEFSASAILNGLKAHGAGNKDDILWFQHETAIWADSQKFTTMLKYLDKPKVVTFHTLHFQSPETPFGLRQYQYQLLRDVLPHVEAITVFSHGVRRAVTTAFPEHYQKVSVLKHGIRPYPQVNSMSRTEAKEKLNDFLLYEAGLDRATKEALSRQRVLLDPDTVVVGQTGFLCPLKQSGLLYTARDDLQKIVPHKRIVAVRIGGPREDSHKHYAERLRKEQNGTDKFLVETWLPQYMLPLAQRAFDVNFHWPRECTQSGVLAHAFGAGALVAGRDLEGLGETLREAGALVDVDLGRLLLKIRNIILNPALRESTEEKALEYAKEFSWEEQARRHYQLARQIMSPVPVRPASHSPVAIDTATFAPRNA